MNKTAAQKLKGAMKPGRVYRRLELAPYCSSVTRELNTLVEQGEIVRAAHGLYYRPKMTSVGPAPATSEELVRAFLSNGDFLFLSFNEYNLLGLGLTQLYNQQFVYNHKRQGDFVLDGRRFSFRRRRDFPKKLTKEFLLVDLLNNKKELSGNTRDLEKLIGLRARTADRGELLKAAKKYGKLATRKFLDEVVAGRN